MDIIFDCKYGVSGDMLVGALLDIGADKNALIEFLNSLKLEEFKIIITRLKKGNIYCTDFDVRFSEDNHDHDMSYLYSGSSNVLSEPKLKRNLKDIEKIINLSSLKSKFKLIAKKIFEAIAMAEAKAHNVNVNEVVFHETGAMDSIIDIMSVVFCLQNLGVEKVYAKNLNEGNGFVNCRKGRLSLPTPAVKNIAEKFDIDIVINDLPYELITPTGLGVLAVVANFYNIESTAKGVGYGSGKRNYNLPGVLKVEVI